MIVVSHILPALRASIAQQLVNTYGLKKIDVADKMAITPAAVTQYLGKIRGDSGAIILEESEASDLIKEIAEDIAKEETPADILLLKLCRACSKIRAEGLICSLHKEEMPTLRGIDTCACGLGLIET